MAPGVRGCSPFEKKAMPYFMASEVGDQLRSKQARADLPTLCVPPVTRGVESAMALAFLTRDAVHHTLPLARFAAFRLGLAVPHFPTIGVDVEIGGETVDSIPNLLTGGGETGILRQLLVLFGRITHSPVVDGTIEQVVVGLLDQLAHIFRQVLIPPGTNPLLEGFLVRLLSHDTSSYLRSLKAACDNSVSPYTSV